MPFTCTNPAEVEAAMDAVAPRDPKEVMQERFPECTFDVNGRAHAPFDGYEDAETGKLYRGGEYLPTPECEKDDWSMFRAGKPSNMVSAVSPEGVSLEWFGTKRQREAAYAVLKAQSNAFDAARSNHIAEIGVKVSIAGSLQACKRMEGFYGVEFFQVIRTVEGAIVIYKGAKKLGEKGATVALTAKVKRHEEREGVKQTWIERPKLA